jgi:hypothetical protein
MGKNIQGVLAAAVARILRPLVRILLKNGISYRTFADIARSQFVEIAQKELGIEGRKQSVSRIALITGLTRKEVSRLLEFSVPSDRRKSDRYHRASRVIAGWKRDKDFLNSRGKPDILPISGPGKTFQQIVARYSGDIPHRAVLDELLRAEVVVCPDENRVKLIKPAYLPRGDEAMKLHILGVDTSYLIETIGHNLQRGESEAFFQRKVLYDNLPDEVLPRLRRLSSRSAQALLEKLDTWLSSHDRDVNPQVKGRGRNTAGVGIYYFQGPYTHLKPEDLNRGTRLIVRGTLTNRSILADEVRRPEDIRMESNLSSINLAENRLALSGLESASALTTATTRIIGISSQLDQIQPGDHVRLLGRRSSGGDILASSLQITPSAETVELAGLVESVSDPFIAILGIQVNTAAIPPNGFEGVNGTPISPAEFFGIVKPGDAVALEGTLQGGSVSWSAVRLE